MYEYYSDISYCYLSIRIIFADAGLCYVAEISASYIDNAGRLDSFERLIDCSICSHMVVSI